MCQKNILEHIKNKNNKADRRFGMDDLGMIIEKITKNRYYPYPPSQPILASQFSVRNLNKILKKHKKSYLI